MTEITSRRNPAILHLKKLGADAVYRRECGEFFCDGRKLLEEAVQNGAAISAVLFSGDMPERLPDGVALYSAPQDVLSTVSPLKSPQDVVFSCRMPATAATVMDGGCRIILEGLQDPGNVGTILRTASAFGAGAVYLTGGCADPYNPKAVRASMGAIFRQPVVQIDLDGLREMKQSGMRLLGAALGESVTDARQADFTNAAIAVGSEGSGLSAALLALCDQIVKIPMTPGSESLNAATAAAILLWEAMKKAL